MKQLPTHLLTRCHKILCFFFEGFLKLQINQFEYQSIENCNIQSTELFNQIVACYYAKKIDLVSPPSNLPENELPSVIEILAYNKSLENLNKSNDIGKYFIHMSKLR